MESEEKDKSHPRQLPSHLILIRWLSVLFKILIRQGGPLLPSLEVNIEERDCASKYRVDIFTYVSVLQSSLMT